MNMHIKLMNALVNWLIRRITYYIRHAEKSQQNVKERAVGRLLWDRIFQGSRISGYNEHFMFNIVTYTALKRPLR